MMCEHGGEHFSWHFVCNKCGMPGSDAILETALAAANARAELAERQLEETRNVRNALFISLEAANARIAELEATLNQHDEISERLARKFIEKAQEQQQVAISRAEQAEASCAAMRPEVRWFAEKMEQTLKENDHKGGWSDCDNAWLLKRLKEETQELSDVLDEYLAEQLQNDIHPVTVGLLIREATDVANFAMMIAENNRAEPLTTTAGSALLAELQRYREALEVLSRLGNGDRLGNSDGNRIAQAALSASSSISTDIV